MHVIRNQLAYIFSILFRYKIVLILVILIEVSFLMRLHQWYSISFHDESSRDYLVANHIYKYHEFPLAGPHDEGRYFLRNSPFYFYFLSMFLYIQDSLNFLELVNISLQLANILIIYLLAKRLFGIYPALLSSTIFALGNYFISQSNILWQPYIMQPFVNLSYLLLVIGYQKRKYSVLITSLVIFLLSATLHRSALAQLPLMLTLIFFILKSWKANLVTYISTAITFIVINLLLYLPVLFSNLGSINTAQSLIINTSREELSRLLPGILLVLLSYLLLGKGTHRRISFIMMVAIFLQFSLAAFFGLTDIRYFTPILALFVILVSAAIIQFCQRSKLHNLIGIALVVFVITTISPNLYGKFINSLRAGKKADFPPAAVVVNKVVEIKKTDKFPDYKFFRVVTYRNGSRYGRIEAAFWVPLEKNLNQKFLTVDENTLLNNTFYDINNYYETNSNNYYFIICYEYHNLDHINEYCLNNFLRENKSFSIVDLIYQGIVHENISIYLAMRK